jgi:hypothetical protein
VGRAPGRQPQGPQEHEHGLLVRSLISRGKFRFSEPTFFAFPLSKNSINEMSIFLELHNKKDNTLKSFFPLLLLSQTII